MSNLKILKNWGDNNLLELSVSAESEFVTIRQMCYVQDTDLKKLEKKLLRTLLILQRKLMWNLEKRKEILHQHFL